MRPARSLLAQALREARQTVGLTQDELGRQLGLNSRAIYRWERDENAPTDLNLRRVVQVIAALHEAAASKLSAVIANQAAPSAADAPPTSPLPAASTAQSRALIIERGVFSMADELDVAPRRVRGALSRWLRRVREANLALDVVQHEIDTWNGDAQ
jgi:transcriptional regulator with XRE-family HTH domain